MRSLLTLILCAAAWCGPPASMKPLSWYGLTHEPLTGCLMHTSNVPSARRGIPSAPGYVAK